MTKTALLSSHCKAFFHDVAEAKKRVLLVDYDGTLAPFHEDRNQASPYPEIPELLQRISTRCGTRVVVISSRPANQVTPLLGAHLAVETWGAYGLERVYPDGSYSSAQISDDSFDALAESEVLLEEKGLRKHLEVSPAAVAVHWRGLAPFEVLALHTEAYRVLNPIASRSGLIIADFDGGMKIRLPSACTGYAVRSVLPEIASDDPIAYLGDDTCDEDAFRLLNGRGLTVLVRPKYRFTAAQLWLRPPDELRGFLKDWIYACEGAS